MAWKKFKKRLQEVVGGVGSESEVKGRWNMEVALQSQIEGL